MLRISLSLGAAGALLWLAAATAAAPPPGGQDWPQWRGAARDGVWKETGLLSRFPGADLTSRWKAPIGTGYSGPTVAQGRVYLMDRSVEPTETEGILCFDWETGERLWSHRYECPYRGIGYPDGPRASVTVHEGRAYALGAMGHANCLDAVTGRVIWSRNLNADYKIRLPDWGIAASPLVDGELVILNIGGSDNASLVALDRSTGAERWRALPDRGSYSPPIIINQAGKRVLIAWTGERVTGLDPATGKLYWEFPWLPRVRVVAIATPVVRGDLLFLTSFHEGSLLLRLRTDRLAVDKVWQRAGQNERSTDAIQTMISTPVFDGTHVYGMDTYGELRCLDARNGDRVWENQTAVPRSRGANIHFVQNGDRYWLFNERGELIIARLSPKGYDEISRARLIKPTRGQFPQRDGVCWSHPAFAYRHVFIRNDEELVCASLEAR